MTINWCASNTGMDLEYLYRTGVVKLLYRRAVYAFVSISFYVLYVEKYIFYEFDLRFTKHFFFLNFALIKIPQKYNSQDFYFIFIIIY